MPLKPVKGTSTACRPCSAGIIPAFGLRIGISLALAGQLMVFSLGFNNSRGIDDSLLYGSAAYWLLHSALILLSLLVVLLLGKPLLREFLDAVRAGKLTVEALFVLSAAGALAGSLVSTVSGTGSVYYEVVAIVLCVYAIGKQIGAMQKGRVGEAVATLRTAFDTARIRRGGEGLRECPVSEVQPGDLVLVSPGEPIPVDGYLAEGSGYVRETPMTGEPSPVARHPGDRVLAGTWSVDGSFTIAPDTGQPRLLDPILEVLNKAPREPARLQVTADRLMQGFVPLVSLVSAATFAGWLLLSHVPWWEALFNAMAVLLVACPCALGLAMPTGIWAALFYLSQRGVIGRHGHLLDTLAGCTVVVFDKTGTLTAFDPGIRHQFAGVSEEESDIILKELASLSSVSSHPVSGALGRLSEDRWPVIHHTVYPGLGLCGTVGASRLWVGESALLEAQGIDPREAPEGLGGKPVHVARNGRHIGWIVLQERLRDSALPVLQSLRDLGCRTEILSGDPSPYLEEIGGVPVRGGLSPEDKAAEVRALVRSGETVLFVGDGINDVLAMEASSGGMAIELGAALASEYADGILIGGEVAALPSAIRKARYLHRHLKGNLLFALSYNVLGMALAAAGLLHPVVAALLMVGSSMIVSFRALRAAGAG